MTDHESCARCACAFDLAFARRAGGFQLEPEADRHLPILMHLFEACSPLAGALPAPLLRLQARAQYDSHRAQHPHAMRRIVALRDTLAGRIVLDWSAVGSVAGVDIAVFPEFRSGAIGLTMLRAWTEAADAEQRVARLTVVRDNPAARIYARLGFVVRNDDGFAPLITMERAPKAGASLLV